MIRSVDTDELKCEKCGEPLDLSRLVDGHEIDVDIHEPAGHMQSAEFDLECQCCGYLNTLEFVFEEDDRAYPH